MQCPFCRATDTKVIDSRNVNEGAQVRRRRECIRCLERFTTYENIELTLPRLIKHDGNFEQFDETKLRSGVLRALEKRAVPMETVDKIINNIISKLRGSVDREVPTRTLGSWVMEELKEIDEVGYVRFASVYHKFKSLDEFKQEIAKLKQETKEYEHEI